MGTEFDEQVRHKKITVKSRPEMMDRIAALRADGWNLVTFGYTLSELEKDDDMIVIERK